MLPVALHWEKKKILCGLCKKVHSIDRKESGKFSAENLIPKIFSNFVLFFGGWSSRSCCGQINGDVTYVELQDQ